MAPSAAAVKTGAMRTAFDMVARCATRQYAGLHEAEREWLARTPTVYIPTGGELVVPIWTVCHSTGLGVQHLVSVKEDGPYL